MKTKKIKILSIVLSLVLVFGVVAVLLFPRQNANAFAAEVVIENGWSQSSGALVGETLTPPESVKLKIDENTEIDVESGLIYFPDGSAKTLEPKLLSMPGKYTLHYEGTHEGKKVVGEYSFMVEESNYYVGNPALSSAQYVKADEITFGGEKVAPVGATDGIKVVLADGDYFRFNKSINLYDVAEQNDGIVNVSMAYPMQDASILSAENGGIDQGTNRFGTWINRYFTIKLIDCYDESNYVEFAYWCFQYKSSSGEYSKYYRFGAGAADQTIGAIKESTSASASIVIGDKTYAFSGNERYDDGYIGRMHYGFENTYELFKDADAELFSYNPTTHEVYFSNGTNVFINDLDNEQIYPNSNFKGFTTGEVYVQYQFQNSEKTGAKEFYVKSILDLSEEQLKPAGVSDTLIPRVDIDVEYTDAENSAINIPYGKEFEIPKATVYDVNGDGDYQLAVYYDYYTDTPKAVTVKDGKFTPSKKGVTYTAIYVAKDSFGNTNMDDSGKCMNVINMVAVDGNAFNYTENAISSLSAAELNYLPKLEATTINKDLTIKVNAIEPNGNVVDITDSFDGNNYSFAPEFIGEYTIKYILEDNVNVEEYSYKVSSVDNGSVMLTDKLVLPSIFIKDAVYDLEPYFAKIATTNGVETRQADIYVSADGGEFTKIANVRKYTASASSTLTFKAVYNGQETATQTALVTDVNFTENGEVNGGKKTYENYFVGFDSVVKEASYVEYGFDGTKDVDLKFASPLVFNAFSLDFEVTEESASQISAVSVLIKAIGQDDEGYVLTFAKSGNGTYSTVKGLDGTSYYARTDTDIPLAGEHSIVIADNVLTIQSGSVYLPALDSKNVEFSLQVVKPLGAFSLRVSNICSTAFRDNVREKAAQLVYTFPIGKAYVGAEYVIPKFNINSIWEPVSLADFKFSFVDDEGNALVDKNGNKVQNLTADSDEIVVIPNAVKTYNFEFSCSTVRVVDSKNFSLAVADNTAPVITFDDGSDKNTVIEVPVLTMHTIKSFTVTDDVTKGEDLYIRVCVMTDSSALIEWGITTGEVGFEKEGTYRIMIYAQDSAKNVSTAYYNVVVTAKSK